MHAPALVSDLAPAAALRRGPAAAAGSRRAAGSVAVPRLQTLQARIDQSPRMAAQRRLLGPNDAAASPSSRTALVAQRVVIDGDMQLNTEQAWDEIEWMIKDRRIPAEHLPGMKADLAQMPEDRGFDTFDDLVDELERLLCEREQRAHPWAGPDGARDLDGDGAPGGLFWTFLKYFSYYLLLMHVLQNVTGARAQVLGAIEVSDEPEEELARTYPPGEVLCEPGMAYFCSDDALLNRVYADAIQTLRAENGTAVTVGTGGGQGACRFTPHPPFMMGTVSCDAANSRPQDLPKVAHELEHGADFMSGVMHSRGPAADWVDSELNALTRQAAVARVEMNLGRPVDARDRALVKDFDAGCPSGGKLYEYLQTYTMLYLKTSPSLGEVETDWRACVAGAVLRYADWIDDGPP